MIDKAYSYDDLLLVPQRSPVDSRSDAVLDTQVTPNVNVSSPLISAPMDSVTGAEMAQAMYDNGGVGIIHRFQDTEDQVEAVEEVDGTVGASIGLGRKERESAYILESAGVDFICVDVAHAHMEKAIQFVERLNEAIDVDIMVGNVVTHQAVQDLVEVGADAIKVGIGPGSACTTREKTGHGVPQATAIRECSANLFMNDDEFTIIADGGIQKPGDAVKALALGADAVMMGGVFGRCEESLEDGNVWGMASENGNDQDYIEGVVSEGEEKYTVSQVFEEFEQGIRSGMSYSGAHDIETLQTRSEFMEITPATQERNGGFEV